MKEISFPLADKFIAPNLSAANSRRPASLAVAHPLGNPSPCNGNHPQAISLFTTFQIAFDHTARFF
jgi:hypothetical protein